MVTDYEAIFSLRYTRGSEQIFPMIWFAPHASSGVVLTSRGSALRSSSNGIVVAVNIRSRSESWKRGEMRSCCSEIKYIDGKILRNKTWD